MQNNFRVFEELLFFEFCISGFLVLGLPNLGCLETRAFHTELHEVYNNERYAGATK